MFFYREQVLMCLLAGVIPNKEKIYFFIHIGLYYKELCDVKILDGWIILVVCGGM